MRAATEPVKVEAMHAIFVFGFGGLFVCVCVGMTRVRGVAKYLSRLTRSVPPHATHDAEALVENHPDWILLQVNLKRCDRIGSDPAIQ